MPKKRKCRYTTEELEVHEQAVKLRKMTDQQLVDAFNKARNGVQTASETHDVVNSNDTTNDAGVIRQLLEALSEGKCKGIGNGTVYKITEFAKEMGML